MTPRTRASVGALAVFAVTVLVAGALPAGPAAAQEMTEGGDDAMTTETMGNGTMTNESMDGGSMTEESMTDGDVDGESTAEESTAGEDVDGANMDDESTTEEGMDEEATTEERRDDESMSDRETGTGGQPGFGIVLGLTALAAAAGIARYRRHG